MIFFNEREEAKWLTVDFRQLVKKIPKMETLVNLVQKIMLGGVIF